MQEYEKKSGRSEKLHTSIKRNDQGVLIPRKMTLVCK